MSESAAEFELLSALTFPSALASARREACPLLVLPRSWEHIQSSGVGGMLLEKLEEQSP